MAKTNMLTMRVDDKLLERLNACLGDSMAQKFENLVYKCCDELPQYQKLCGLEKERLEKLRAQCRETMQLLTDLKQLNMYQTHMMGAYQEHMKSMERLSTLADKLTGTKM